MVERSQRIRERYYLFLIRCLFLLGLVLVFVGLVVNATFFEQFVSYDGVLEEATKQLILYVQMGLVTVGIVLCLVGRSLDGVSSRVKEFVINSSLFLLSAFVVLLFIEMGMRFVSPSATVFSVVGTDPAVFESSDIIPWTLKPNASERFVALDFDTTVSINSFGLRDKERQINKDKNVHRILIVGDSFTYGFGVNNDESYPAVIERELNEKIYDKRFEVWNAGFASGYTADTFFVFLREKGMRFNPDLILVGVFLENDILDFLKNKYVFDDSGKLTRVVSDFYCVEEGHLRRDCDQRKKTQLAVVSHAVRRFLLGNSRIYSYVVTKLGIIQSMDSNPVFDKKFSSSMVENFDKFFHYIGEIKNVADSRNIDFGLILLPGKSSVNEFWDVYQKGHPCADRDKPRRLISDYCKKNKIVCLDVWPYFINASDSKRAYFEHDAHWSKEGNERGGKIIADLLIKNKLIQ